MGRPENGGRRANATTTSGKIYSARFKSSVEVLSPAIGVRFREYREAMSKYRRITKSREITRIRTSIRCNC